jgi:serine protease AprX
MIRWRALPVLVLVSLVACQDDAPAPTAPPDASASLLGTVPRLTGAVLEGELSRLLATTLPTDRLSVIVNLDEAASRDDVASRVLALGAGVIRFRNLPMVAALATPAQVLGIQRLAGVQSVYHNKRLQYLMAESNRVIRSPEVWAMGYTGKGVGVAILDSGIDGLYNPGLAYGSKTVANVKLLADLDELFTFGDSLPEVGFGSDLFVSNVPTSETSMGHGTHVAGIAAGDGSGSSAGIYKGVAPGANLIGIGAGDALFVLWTLAGFDYILENRERYNIQVVNNSWGTTGEYDPNHPIVRASKAAYDAGIAVVFAAGNEGPGENTLNPYSAAPWVISVAAGCKVGITDPTSSVESCNDGRSGILADFSSRGIPGDAVVRPDVVAPGVNIVSTRAALGLGMNALDLPSDLQTCNISTQHLQYFTCSSGTSMAAPHVAGVIALMEEAAKGRLTPGQAYSAITRTATPLPGYAPWEVGSGYVNALAAVKSVRR